MPSFELIYDQEEDVLEATFESFDEQFGRSIALNDNIIFYADNDLTSAGGLTFYSFAQLLQVNETDLDGLHSLPEIEARKALALLSRFPISLFLQVLDPTALRARVTAPDIQEMLPHR